MSLSVRVCVVSSIKKNVLYCIPIHFAYTVRSMLRIWYINLFPSFSCKIFEWMIFNKTSRKLPIKIMRFFLCFQISLLLFRQTLSFYRSYAISVYLSLSVNLITFWIFSSFFPFILSNTVQEKAKNSHTSIATIVCYFSTSLLNPMPDSHNTRFVYIDLPWHTFSILTSKGMTVYAHMHTRTKSISNKTQLLKCKLI